MQDMTQIISRRPRSVFQYHKGNVKQNLVRTVAHSCLEDEVFSVGKVRGITTQPTISYLSKTRRPEPVAFQSEYVLFPLS